MKNILRQQPRGLPRHIGAENVRLVPVEPKVKLAKTCELSNNHARDFRGSAKSTDPTCYNSPTVDLTGLFENVERDMERSVALKKLGALLGKKLAYRVDPKAPKQDERDAARIELRAAIEERNDMERRRDERRRAILEGDAEYQKLFADHKAARERCDKLSWITMQHKITVGTTQGVGGISFFSVKAEGDTWEEVIARLQTKEKVA